MIYCGRKSDLNKFNRIYLPKDLIIEFNDDGSDRIVRMKTGKENGPDIYPRLPYLACGCENKNKYYFYTDTAKKEWIICHNLKGRPIIQLYNNKDELINAEIHYLDENRVKVTFSEPVAGYAICLLVREQSMIYKGTGNVWEINHNLDNKPFTQVFTSAGYMINAEIKHIDNNNTRITFSQEVNGYAILIVEPDASYVHTQTELSSEWRIKHMLGEYCLVQLVDPNLYVKISEIKQITRNEVKVVFSEPTAGEAICVASYSKTKQRNSGGGVKVVEQYDLPDVAEAQMNTLYVLKPSGFAYITNDNFQWITLNVGPTRIDGNNYNDNADTVDGNRQNDNEMIIDERNLN